MKLSATTIGIPLAIVLLAVAAGAVMATSGGPAAPEAQAPVPAAPTPSPEPARKPVKVDTVLTDALDKLVAKGTITADQKAAILESIAAEKAARKDEFKAAKEKAKADLQQVKGFLADGVITQEEFDTLPADSWLRTMAGAMDDGTITTDELKALGRGGPFFGGDKGRGHGYGHGWSGKDKAPKAAPTPAAGTSG